MPAPSWCRTPLREHVLHQRRTKESLMSNDGEGALCLGIDLAWWGGSRNQRASRIETIVAARIDDVDAPPRRHRLWSRPRARVPIGYLSKGSPCAGLSWLTKPPRPGNQHMTLQRYPELSIVCLPELSHLLGPWDPLEARTMALLAHAKSARPAYGGDDSEFFGSRQNDGRKNALAQFWRAQVAQFCLAAKHDQV